MRKKSANTEIQTVSTQAALVVALLVGTVPVLYHGLGGEFLTALLLSSLIVVLLPWFKDLLPEFLRGPPPEPRPLRRYPVLAGIATVFWLAVLASALALLDRSTLSPRLDNLVVVVLGTGALLWIIDAWLAKAQANGPGGFGQVMALGLLAWCWHLQRTPPKPERTVDLHLPWDQPTRVLEGGPSPLHNRHYFVTTTQDAVELSVQAPSPRQSPAATESPSWDVPVLAPAAGQVELAVDDDPDNAPGRHGTFGNQVILKLAPDRFLLLGHLRQGSVLVHVGDQVHVGTPLGRCGSSGAAKGPRLHLQAMTLGNMRSPLCTTLPLRFAFVSGDAFARKGALLRNLP